MKQELIYQAILSTLAHEATDEETKKIVDEWLRESEENREEYEGMRRMYEKATAPRKPNQFDADRAWKQVATIPYIKRKVGICLCGCAMRCSCCSCCGGKRIVLYHRLVPCGQSGWDRHDGLQ